MSSTKWFCVAIVIECAIVAVVAQECGLVKYSSGLIFGGTYAKRGQWPWLCTLHDSSSEEFFCGSTLVSARHVVTGE